MATRESKANRQYNKGMEVMRRKMEAEKKEIEEKAKLMVLKERESLKRDRQQLLDEIKTMQTKLSNSEELNRKLKDDLWREKEEVNSLHQRFFTVKEKHDATIVAVDEFDKEREKAEEDMKKKLKASVEEYKSASLLKSTEEIWQQKISQLEELLIEKDQQINRAITKRRARTKAHVMTLVQLNEVQSALKQSKLSCQALEEKLQEQLESHKKEREESLQRQLKEKELSFSRQLAQEHEHQKELTEKGDSQKKKLKERVKCLQKQLKDRDEHLHKQLMEKEESLQNQLMEKELSFRRQLAQKDEDQQELLKKEGRQQKKLKARVERLQERLKEMKKSLKSHLKEKKESARKPLVQQDVDQKELSEQVERNHNKDSDTEEDFGKKVWERGERLWKEHNDRKECFRRKMAKREELQKQLSEKESPKRELKGTVESLQKQPKESGDHLQKDLDNSERCFRKNAALRQEFKTTRGENHMSVFGNCCRLPTSTHSFSSHSLI